MDAECQTRRHFLGERATLKIDIETHMISNRFIYQRTPRPALQFAARHACMNCSWCRQIAASHSSLFALLSWRDLPPFIVDGSGKRSSSLFRCSRKLEIRHAYPPSCVFGHEEKESRFFRKADVSCSRVLEQGATGLTSPMAGMAKHSRAFSMSKLLELASVRVHSTDEALPLRASWHSPHRESHTVHLVERHNQSRSRPSDSHCQYLRHEPCSTPTIRRFNLSCEA